MKCQTNSEIAGSPRNALRCSVDYTSGAGRALTGLGGRPLTKPNQTAKRPAVVGSETARDKLRCQKGNSPDHRLRSLSQS